MLHFYEGQVRKFLTQFIRILSNFSVETGRGSDGQIALKPIPVVYGDPTRQVANIIRNNSENALNYADKWRFNQDFSKSQKQSGWIEFIFLSHN